MTSPDLDTLIARLQGDAVHYGNPTYSAAATALEQMRAELAAALEDVSELRALDNEAQHGVDALRAELEACKAQITLERKQHCQEMREEQKAAREDAREAVAEARWQAKQGDDYGNY